MTEVEPYFFFSYSQADNDGNYLHDFFEKLRIRVSQRLGLAINPREPGAEERLNKVGFCDRYGVKAGQDWEEKIGTKLRTTGVLVCAYSPNFFSKVQNKQFCGREVRAFLMRDERINFPTSKDAWKDFQIDADCCILPVLWDSLDERDHPPRALRKLTWWLDKESVSEDFGTLYLKKGMTYIVRTAGLPRAGAAYAEILDYLAERIREIMKEPLPALNKELHFDDLRSGFQPEENGINGGMAPAGAGEVAAIPMTGGAKRMFVIEVRHLNGSGISAHNPGELGFRSLFEQVANQRKLELEWLPLDPSGADFANLTLTALGRAKDNSVRAILVVDPRCLAIDAWRDMLIALLHQPCRAGLLLPAGANDEDAVALIRQYGDALKPGKDAPDWVVRPCIGSREELLTAVDSVAHEMCARIVNTDPVRQDPPKNDGPPTRPRIPNR